MILSSGCAYYNYYYNAQKNFDVAEKQRKDASGRAQNRKSSASSSYSKPIASAEKMLEYYPGSKWEDDALLLIAKCHYFDQKYRSSASRADEFLTRFPTSPLEEEARLYKGLSLLKLAQPDSAQEIFNEIYLNSTNKINIALAHYGLGDYYISRKRPEAALPEFRLAAQSATDDIWLRGECWVRAGETLALLNRYDEAVDLYDEILREKIPRRQRFEASFQRATALRESGRVLESYEVCLELLKDGAFVDDFPRVELEAAKALRLLGRIDEALERLDKLVEAEKRGEIGAEGHYLRGLIQWEVFQNDSAALAAFEAARATERSAKIITQGDSLAKEIEGLSLHYRRIRFYDRMQGQLDSARLGLKNLFATDTVWVDSAALRRTNAEKSKEEVSKKKPRDSKGKGRFDPMEDPNDPLSKIVADAMAADPTGRANLLEVEAQALDTVNSDTALIAGSVPDTVKKPLDSLQLYLTDSLFNAEKKLTWLSLAELHLFDRQSLDSAQFYVDILLSTGLDSVLWARCIATKAYIVGSRSDTAAYDSLYRLILEKPPTSDWKTRAEDALGIKAKIPPATQAAALIDSAEALWREQGDAEAARLLYLLAAEVADSGDTAAARGLMAAAYITRSVIGQDSLAKNLYAEVSTRFPGTAYAKAAQKRAPRVAGKQPRSPAIPMEGDASVAEDFYEPDLRHESLPGMPMGEQVFESDKVDEIPVLITSQQMIDDYLRSYYPFEAYSDQMSGRVEVSMVVRANGEITDINVVRSDPEGYGFDEAAIQVMAMVAYRPGRKDGKPVDVRMKQSFQFKFPND